MLNWNFHTTQNLVVWLKDTVTYGSVLQVTIVIKSWLVYSKQSKDIIAKLSNLYQILLT